MAVVGGEDGGYATWAARLEQACLALRPEARWLTAEVGGPFEMVGRMAASDVWGGPYADQLRGAVRFLEGQVWAWGEHLGRLCAALERAAAEAAQAARLESAGIVPDFDLPGALMPWRRWPAPSPMLPSDWSWCGSRSANFVWVDPDRSRVLTEGLRTTADQLLAACSRVVTLLAGIGLEAPVVLRPVAGGLAEVADETDRRVALLEAVDRELAGRFRALAAELGFPGALAPPATFDPADPVGSSLMGLPPGPDVGPGRQPAQAKEADPVSTSTGNFLCEAIDLSQQARGVPVVFARTYNSLGAATDGPLGFGWSHRWGARLVFAGAGVVVVAGDGHEDLHRAEAGDFVAPAGVHDRLRATAAGFEVTTRGGLHQRFDRAGRLVSIGDRSGNALTLGYTNAALTRVVDGSSTVTTLEHDDAGRILSVEGTLRRRWTYAYSDVGDLVGVTDPEGGCTVYAYDRSHRLVSITDPEGGRVVDNGYDREGRVVTQDDGAGGRWTYRYEPGRTLVTDPIGRSRLFAFDERRRTTSLVDAAGAATRFAWNDASNLVGVTDGTGRTSRFSWDSAGHLVSAAGPGSAPVNLEWQDGNVVAVAAGDSRWLFSWDALARPTGIVSAAGITTTLTWSAEGMPETTVAGDGGVTRYGYDERGHLASVTDPLGAVARVECDAAGRPVAEVHPGGDRTIFGWDGRDRLTSVTDATGGVTRYRYDRCGRLVAFEDPLGRVTCYRYEGRGLLAAVVDPTGRETTFTYDACGRLSSRTDPRGVTLALTYDPAGRITRLGGPGLASVTYRWDAAGRLVGMTDGTGETTWELDSAGRPARERRPGGVELLHRYDALGRRDRLELRRGETVVGIWEYSFDADGRIVDLADPTGGRTALGYDAIGRLTSVSHPNGAATTMTMDLAGQPIRVVTTGPDRRTIAAWENTYDDDGNLLRRQASGDSPDHAETTAYTYDQLGRLASASGHGTESWTYRWDSASNCVAMRHGTEPPVAVTVDNADQVTAAGTARFQYDPAGNLTARNGGDQPILVISYDPLGRVTRISSDDADVTFTYDGLGRRVRRSEGRSTVIRVYDSATVIAELAGDGDDGTDGAVRYSAAGLLVLNRATPRGTGYLHPDANTNVAVVTDDHGAVAARFAYSPFGIRTTDGDPDVAGPLGFCGVLGVQEETGGLLDMRARFYDPALGRFSSPDPWPAYLPEPITLNRYLYALGDPVSQVDPYGLFCLTGKNSQGKCRGLKDVAKRVSEPLGTISTVATGAAAIMAGITALCPLPCGPITGTAAAVFEGVAIAARVTVLATGTVSTVAECVGSGLTSFGCMASAASTAVSTVFVSGLKVGRVPLGLTEPLQNFADNTFAFFLGTSALGAQRMSK